MKKPADPAGSAGSWAGKFLIFRPEDSQGKFPAVLDPLPEFRGGGKQHVAGGVDRRFTGILNDADDEAHRHDLHGDIIIDAKHGAGHRDQQQGAAGNA